MVAADTFYQQDQRIRQRAQLGARRNFGGNQINVDTRTNGGITCVHPALQHSER
jgi:hypothetical protein